MKYIGYLIQDQENLSQIEWCFVIKTNFDKTSFKDLDDGSYAFSTNNVIDWHDFIGEYESDVLYAEDKDLHDNYNDACKDIIRDLFKIFGGNDAL